MTRALPRTNFNSSRLIRFLSDLAVVDVVEPGQAFAERLGLWLDFTDAITLYAAHNASAAGSRPAGAVASSDVEEEFARVSASLTDSINRSCSPQRGETRLELPLPQTGAPLEVLAAYEPYRRFYLAHQREMEVTVRPLRARVRQVLSGYSPRLKPLVELDGALDQILSEREGKLLATVPLLLEKRFAQLFKAHQARLAEAAQVDEPALWMHPGGWLAGFCQELQAVLLAELDLRLQPVAGLIDAFRNEKTQH